MGTDSWASFFPPLPPCRGVRVPPPLLGEFFLGDFPFPLAAAAAAVRSARIRDASAFSRTCDGATVDASPPVPRVDSWPRRPGGRAPSRNHLITPLFTYTATREGGYVQAYAEVVHVCRSGVLHGVLLVVWLMLLCQLAPVQVRTDRSAFWAKTHWE